MDDLAARVRRADEDRWLASRFASADVRAKLIALYALNDEIARTSEVVKQPMLADIRLAWWREGLGEIYGGQRPRAHPVLEAFAQARHPAWPLTAFETLIEARRRDAEIAPVQSVGALTSYIDATAGQMMRLSLVACGVAEIAEAFVAPAARAWGLVGWLRAGRPMPVGESAETLRVLALKAHDEALAVRMPPEAFPAIGYVVLAPGYLRALARGERDRPLLLRQLKLVAAAATGSL
jgi:phytoene synthase